MTNSDKIRSYRKNRIKSEKSKIIAMSIVFVVFLIYSVTLVYPFIWLVLNSLKTRFEFNNDLWGLPLSFFIENYVTAFSMEYNGVNILQMIGNSLIFVVGMTTTSMFFVTITAYVFSRYRFWCKDFLWTFQFVMMLIPTVGNIAAVYKLYHVLGFYDTYWGLIVTRTSGFGMGFLMLYAFFKNVSWSYAEAAFIDGAGHFQVMFKIMVPMAMPAIIAWSIKAAIGVWNDYLTFYLYAPTKITLAYGLYSLSVANKFGKISYPELFAALVLSSLPVIAVYALCQNFIVKNTSLGGLKG